MKKKTKCKKGHRLEDPNLVHRIVNGKEVRECRECANAGFRRRRKIKSKNKTKRAGRSTPEAREAVMAKQQEQQSPVDVGSALTDPMSFLESAPMQADLALGDVDRGDSASPHAITPQPREGYSYFLSNKTTGQVIDLGQSCELKANVAEQYGIVAENWEEEWEFGCTKIGQSNLSSPGDLLFKLCPGAPTYRATGYVEVPKGELKHVTIDVSEEQAQNMINGEEPGFTMECVSKLAPPEADPVGIEGTIDIADLVFHKGTRETWTVASVRNGMVSWCGYPEGRAPEADCILIEKATPERRLEVLRALAAEMGDDHRARDARRVLEDEQTSHLVAKQEVAAESKTVKVVETLHAPHGIPVQTDAHGNRFDPVTRTVPSTAPIPPPRRAGCAHGFANPMLCPQCRAGV